MKSSPESSSEKLNVSLVVAAPSVAPARTVKVGVVTGWIINPDWVELVEKERDNALAIVQRLNEENDKLTTRLDRLEHINNELEGTVDDLRNKLDRTGYR